ncbi:osmoprotectant transport system permease protein [Amycolatopsis bartoniae]|uniref:Glycine/betaine ABC transporter permease n=1 Tax=Amycolatopsis bartoniae TaxID=941986 RepID=A0A8H9IW16_9PSEU|nr:ABC transporter permease [Amycolatopsis bartoniae]MBB2933608.1 osmoprotectant transport system permease protein [Amycolatopsis bartoniae]TVT10783.1 ABC transporter permease [Amycolatopsis bartoniae]GHF72927.1 glycine/betaine ABC transporter permease [Amycolatopsis bartoniae]
MNVIVLADSDRPLFEWRWVERNADNILQRLGEHLSLTATALAIGLVVSIGLAVLSLRWRWFYPVALSTAGALYVVPSLGAFALLVPFFGLSFTTAVIPLATYTLLILLRNIVTGIEQVPADVREAAVGMGFTRAKLLVRVELPLALPVVIAGLRVAAVTTIGLVTVTSMLGMGGLGFFIRQGIQTTTPNPTAIIVGIGLSIVLAVVVDLLLWLSERALAPWTRKGRA